MHEHKFTVYNKFVKWENALFIKQIVGIGIVFSITNDMNGFFLQFKYSRNVGLRCDAHDDLAIHEMAMEKGKMEQFPVDMISS
jgi:hypothetical protein